MLSDELFVVLFQSFVVPLQQISISNSCRRVSRSHLDSLRTRSHTSFTSRRHRQKKRLKTRGNQGRKLLSGFLFLFKPTQRFACLSFIYLIYFVFVWSRLWAWCVFNLPQRPDSALSQVQVPVGGLGLRVIHPHKQTVQHRGINGWTSGDKQDLLLLAEYRRLFLIVGVMWGRKRLIGVQSWDADFSRMWSGEKALGGGGRACDRHSRSIKARCSQRNAGMSRLPWLTGVFAYILPTVCWHVCSSFLISNADVRVRDSTVFQTSVIAV